MLLLLNGYLFIVTLSTQKHAYFLLLFKPIDASKFLDIWPLIEQFVYCCYPLTHRFQVHMLLVYQCHDTCAILSTHGLTGFLGWVAQLVLQIKDMDDQTA